ncbi:MAG: hypothetical protein DRQ51_05550 [Gammaproteobacteria bacterium]|nr:MAG: hypothetical protein DRQ51_05550 [Gammaproteobacteria bacterium]
MNNNKNSTKAQIEKILKNLQINKINYDLTDIKKIAKNADLINLHSFVIAIAGTNGKGSIVNIIQAIALKNNIKVASYTSPHILEFNERIKINGKNISDDSLLEHFNYVQNLTGSADLSYFETTTLVALSFFKQQKCDLILLEAGLGGRLDATNIVTSDILIINTIALDHCEYLGDNITAIACEKAGLVKKNQQVILGTKNPPIKMIQLLLKSTKKIHKINKDFNIKHNNFKIVWSNKNNKKSYNFKAPPSLVSSHQLDNLSVSLQAINLLPFDINNIEHALDGFLNFGRGNTITCFGKNFIIDVAHNAESCCALQKNLKKTEQKFTAIFSVLDDKDVEAIIKTMNDVIDVFLLYPLSTPRAMSRKMLNKKFTKYCKTDFLMFSDMKKIISYLQKNNKNDNIVVFGSFYIIDGLLKLCHNFNKNQIIQKTTKQTYLKD